MRRCEKITWDYFCRWESIEDEGVKILSGGGSVGIRTWEGEWAFRSRFGWEDVGGGGRKGEFTILVIH